MLFSPRFQTPQQEIYFQPSPFQLHPDPSSPPSIAISHQCSFPNTPETSRPAISPTSRVAPGRHSLDRESLLNATSIYESQSIWNLSSAEQVCLMRHFIEDLSPWFDICDPRQHFATIIPQRAATSSFLRKAVIATSARHLSRSGRFDSGSADSYYQDCLDDLIPAVHDHDAITDETLLVAAVVLRLLEELDSLSPTDQTDAQGHLIGVQALISAQDGHALPTSSLRAAAFWVGLRQEIFISVISHRSITPCLSQCELDSSHSPADEQTWAYRMVLHCADVLAFAYPSPTELPSAIDDRISKWNSLVDYTHQWLVHRPPFFAPLNQSPPSQPTFGFAMIYFHNETHILGAQHFHLSLILLVLSNPHPLPHTSLSDHTSRSSLRNRLNKLDDTVRTHVRALVGIALAHSKLAPAMNMASMAAAVWGEFFENQGERERLLQLMEDTDEVHSWPTAGARRELRKTWGWEDEGIGGGASGSRIESESEL